MNYNVSPEQVELKYNNHFKSTMRFLIRGAISGILMAISFAILDQLDENHVSKFFPILLIGLIAFGFFFVIVYYYVQVLISFYKFHYICWGTIQDDGYAMATPSKAVGYLFIPIFNLYWLFISIFGLSSQVNQYIDRHKLDDKFKTKKGQTLAFCIFWFIPYIGWAINLFLYFMVIADFKKSCSYLAQTKSKKMAPSVLAMET